MTFATSAALVKNAPDASIGRGNVLVVDDEPGICRVFRRWLEHGGFDVTCVADGDTAVAQIQRVTFDAVITDISMPGMSGIELLRRIRDLHSDVPVILITGAPTVDTAVGAVDNGAFRYLPKPVKVERLVGAVDDAVNASRLSRKKSDALLAMAREDELHSEHALLDSQLDRALQTMWMAYQPIVSNDAREVRAYEALLRAHEGGFPHVGAILDAAEALERIWEIGRRTRALVADNLTQLAEQFDVFVNLHPKDLSDDELYARDAPLTMVAHRVILEITERAQLEEPEKVAGRLMRLRELGFRVAIDDLGAGYSGLSSLVSLNPNFVKIDMSLIRDVNREPRKQRIVRSILEVSEDMNVTVIAEGVETKDELVTLTELGASLLQGYYFSKPAAPFASVRDAAYV